LRKRDSLVDAIREFRMLCKELRSIYPFIIDIINGNLFGKTFNSEGFERFENKNTNFNFHQNFSSNSIDPYKVLGVSKGDSLEKIKKVYKRLVKIYHPDSETGNSEMFKRIQEAYQKIMEEKGGIR